MIQFQPKFFKMEMVKVVAVRHLLLLVLVFVSGLLNKILSQILRALWSNLS